MYKPNSDGTCDVRVWRDTARNITPQPATAAILAEESGASIVLIDGHPYFCRPMHRCNHIEDRIVEGSDVLVRWRCPVHLVSSYTCEPHEALARERARARSAAELAARRAATRAPKAESKIEWTDEELASLTLDYETE